MKIYALLGPVLLLLSTSSLALEKTSPESTKPVPQGTEKSLPYARDETLQTFSKTVHGGVQHVIAKSEKNTRQIKLIQAHLLKISKEFRKGDFSATERIHGVDMPGLVQLKKAETDDVLYEYKALPNGAQIHYSSEYPQLVQALHEWFDAQKSSHGDDAVPEHQRHHTTTAE
jgi:hypothetical protein